MKRFAQLSLHTFLAQAGGLACGLASGVVIARAMGPTAKGAIAVYTLIAGFLALVGNLGLGLANVHLVARNEYPARTAWANSLWVAAAAGSLLAAAAFFLAPLAGIALRRPLDMGLLVISLVSVPWLLWFDYQSNLLRGLQRIGWFNAANLLRQAGRLALLAILVVGLRGGTAGALWSANVALAAAGLACWLLIRSTGNAGLAPSWHRLKAASAYGLKGQAGQLIQFFNYRLDMILLALFWSNREVGIYTTAVFAAELVWYIPSAVATVLLPKISAVTEPAQGADRSARAIRHTLLWSLAAAAVLAALAKPLITGLYGPSFAPAVPALWVLLAGVAALAPGKVIVSHLAAIGKSQYVSYMALAGLGLTLALDLLLIPRYGIIGAAAASALAYGGSGLACLYWMKRETGLGIRSSLVPRRDDWQDYRELMPL
ncbi:MAG TPA: oligosaccharide flippase family protein [Candidatus Edwardsbacteria bacterium]|nr:oligosaccharide flippase family protein [Candidatus Edwardsbacteria bacterium]